MERITRKMLQYKVDRLKQLGYEVLLDRHQPVPAFCEAPEHYLGCGISS